jgi:hypothetical protein
VLSLVQVPGVISDFDFKQQIDKCIEFFTLQTLAWFIAMCLLGVQKLQDVEQFSTMFLTCDLLVQR